MPKHSRHIRNGTNLPRSTYLQFNRQFISSQNNKIGLAIRRLAVKTLPPKKLIYMKSYFYFLIILTFFLSNCSAHREILRDGQAYDNFRGFVPIDPIEYDNQVVIAENGKLINKEIKLLSVDEIFQFLSNETVIVSIGQINAEGKISYLPITISAKHSNYKVTMDYMKFATLPQVDEVGNFIGFNRVGVGLRLITLLTTSEAGINIGDLSSIGLAAKTGKVKGTLMIEIVGIKSKEVTTLLPLPSEINQTTIQNAMQALATIKSKIYDTETELYPQVMAIKPDSSSIKHKVKLKDSLYIESVPKFDHIDNEIKLQIGSNKLALNKFDSAQSLENEAFDLLFKKDITSAIDKFDECERNYPGFHSVYDISKFLKTEKNSLSEFSSDKWKEVYTYILNKYSWKLQNRIIEQLKSESYR